jgi:hypothetical protein
MGFISDEKLFYDMYRLGVSVFQCPLLMFCLVMFSEQALALYLPQVRGGLPIVFLET